MIGTNYLLLIVFSSLLVIDASTASNFQEDRLARLFQKINPKEGFYHQSNPMIRFIRQFRDKNLFWPKNTSISTLSSEKEANEKLDGHSNDDQMYENLDFEDVYSDKRMIKDNYDDYGHSRLGKRIAKPVKHEAKNPDPDYGHMRFG